MLVNSLRSIFTRTCIVKSRKNYSWLYFVENQVEFTKIFICKFKISMP